MSGANGKSDPSVKTCIDAFYRAYVRRHNPLTADRWLDEMATGVPVAERTTPQAQMILPRINGGKDGSLFKKMLADWGEPRVLRLIDEFFGDAYSTWGVVNSNQDVGALFAVAPRLLVRHHAVTQPRRTSNNLDAAARAMGRRAQAEPLQLPPGRK